MLLSILLAITAGISTGIVTGLIPGVHINLISTIVVASYASVSQTIPAELIIIFIMSMSITHTFLDSIPSIFLGAPDPANALAVLPGHRMLLDGEGKLAIKHTLYGSLGGLILSIIFSPILIYAIPLIYNSIKDYIGYIILVFLIILFLKDFKRIPKSLFVFLLAAAFGIFVLDMNLKNPLFLMFSGLFGISNLALSLSTGEITKQKTTEITINVRHKFAIGLSTIMGVVAAFLPGIGSSQTAIIGMTLMKKEDIDDPKVFLTFMGGLNTVNMTVSLITFYTLSKARNGSIVALQSIIGEINLNTLLLIFACALIVGSAATIIGMQLCIGFSKMIVKVNYQKLVLSIIISILIMSVLFDGAIGLIIILLATIIGITASKLNVAKSYLMGCLVMQVLLFTL